MKDKIKQAGFKSQKELASHLAEEEHRVSRWIKKDFRLLDLYLTTLDKLKTLQDYLNIK